MKGGTDSGQHGSNDSMIPLATDTTTDCRHSRTMGPITPWPQCHHRPLRSACPTSSMTSGINMIPGANKMILLHQNEPWSSVWPSVTTEALTAAQPLTSELTSAQTQAWPSVAAQAWTALFSQVTAQATQVRMYLVTAWTTTAHVVIECGPESGHFGDL